MLLDWMLLSLWKGFWHYAHAAAEYPTTFDRRHWIVLSVVAVTLGCLCMRGFGSRKNY